MSLTDLLLHHVERFPDRTALEYDGSVTSWSELLESTRRTAGALARAGARPGDVVGVLLHNSDRFVEAMHAISHAGAIFMPLNWRLAPPELGYILEHSRASGLISEPELEPLIAPIQDQVGCRLLRLGGASGDGWTDLDELAEEGPAQTDAASVAPGDVHRLMYTSGTTSRPKGVMITYGNLWAKNVSHMVEFGMTAGAVGLACGPLYHVGALDLTTSTLMYVGATNHILRRFEAADVLDAIERHRITDVWLAPVMINLIVNDPDLRRRDLSSVRLIIDGGEKMPLPLIERVLEAFPNAWFADAYGLTETVSGDTVLDKGRTKEKLGSVGKPVLHTEVRVVDGDGATCPPGEPGEILLRGPKVCKGYWRDDEATATAIRDGWLHTGDLGLLDEDGFLFVVDRLKDVIVSGGENIASSEVERVLYEHDAVLEAAVVGRPDERWLEVPVAYVVLRDGAAADAVDSLADHCRERLARYKVPKEIRVIEELPRNPSGKVLKRELREREHAGA
ncbi:MAG: long-chain fatty acid--CoA ligase [Solirubrobacterales bacterium]|nr:long-chain fatty acid--CoA ligase [Solirubrobacterales bacterium]